MDKLRRALSGQERESPDEESGFMTNVIDSSKLSWSTRIQGFLICFILGFVLSILGAAFLGIPVKGLRLFIVFYTLGNLTSIAATMFLMGPINQIKKMFSTTRLTATLLMITFLILTLVSALYFHKTALALIFCVCEFLAFSWYSISYIPFARDAVKKAVSSCIG